MRARSRRAAAARAHQLEELAALLDKAGAGQRHLTLIAGEPGIGKTRLAAEAGLGGHRSGATVLYGRADRALGIPYQPIIEALGHWVDLAPRQVLDYLGPEAGELNRLLPGLAARAPHLPRPRGRDEPSGQRYVLFAAVASVLARASAHGPVALIVDDLHEADEPTMLLLRYLLEVPVSLKLLLIETYRTNEVDPRGPLAALRLREDTSVLDPPGLRDRDAEELLGQLLDRGLRDEEIALARRARRDTGGNPLFVGEVLRAYAESGAADVSTSRLETGLPPAAGSAPDRARRGQASGLRSGRDGLRSPGRRLGRGPRLRGRSARRAGRCRPRGHRRDARPRRAGRADQGVSGSRRHVRLRPRPDRPGPLRGPGDGRPGRHAPARRRGAFPRRAPREGRRAGSSLVRIVPA